MARTRARAHDWHNRVQSLLLVVALLALSALTGALVFGEVGLWFALAASAVALLLEPVASPNLVLALYRARPLSAAAAPALWHLSQTLAGRAGLPAPPRLYYLPSPSLTAFAVGNRRASAIALTDGLLATLSVRELAGVLAHEIAHIAHDDLRVMGLADYISRLTGVFALFGQVLLLLTLPGLVLETGPEPDVLFWPALLVLVFSPHLTLLLQLGLSRLREFEADRHAAELTGDARGLAQALARIEQFTPGWRNWLLPGWGNPVPSWLRSHPANSERIRRLQQLG